MLLLITILDIYIHLRGDVCKIIRMLFSELGTDIISGVLSELHPYEVISLQSVSKQWKAIINNSHFIYSNYSKWIFPVPVIRLQKELPNLKLQDLVLDSLLLYPCRKSKRFHSVSALAINAMKAGYSEEFCIDLVTEYSKESEDMIVVAFKYNYGRFISHLQDLVAAARPETFPGSTCRSKPPDTFVNLATCHEFNTSVLKGLGFIVGDFVPSNNTLYTSLHGYLDMDTYCKLIMSVYKNNERVRSGIAKGLSLSTLNLGDSNFTRDNPAIVTGYLIGLHLTPEELQKFIKENNLSVTLPSFREYQSLPIKLCSQFWTEVDNTLVEAEKYKSCLRQYRPDLYLNLPERIGFAGTDYRNPYYTRLVNLHDAATK